MMTIIVAHGGTEIEREETIDDRCSTTALLVDEREGGATWHLGEGTEVMG